MRIICRTALVILLVVNFLTSPALLACGNPVPGRWEKVDMLPSGKLIVLTLKFSDQIAGTFKKSDADTLVVADPSGKERRIPKSEVRKIVSGEQIRDSLSNGALIGMGVGVGVALALLAAAAFSEGEVLPSAKWGAPLLGIGVGLGAGLVIDASQERTEVLYQAKEEVL